MFTQRKTVGALSLVLALSACGSSGSGDAASGSKATTLSVVASTNVYGDIVKQIAGDRVTVTSIISDPAADPHSYEADTRTQLELSKADVVIENGGGYDDFVDTMLKAAGNSDAKVIDVVDISGRKAPAGGELNEHVWYDFPSVEKLVTELVTVLSAKDPADAAVFSSGAATFTKKLQELESTEASIKAAHAGAGVAITEPVPVYLLEASGLVNKTPEEFSEAIEEGTDVPAAVLAETLALFSQKKVSVLAYNEQTSGPETEKVLAAAKSNNIAVVPVTETLPAGQDYLSWMGGNLAALQSALG
ncbi:zinc/manganese transport system substrate-binding protein [Actinoplanes tereljensis]|uniref:Metal ABC transporter substrate-binding protein n=1 Tax=Paractinoplanes tereljensis TaxID=571912 RepID=A0A919NR07_9ACTN|nr:zinc ABC transporter substrate-binding protein [Actinoplanes tereljensis]GIF23536.1 metal ABC transporter substrate-binding protein [Actinoplanes tereljensis]